ncbi:hypothetical protein [Aeromonas veronii]|uniref:hypothetical protein n=1 Tax=Aeromonas veronii TaxID=654 RepID=UPI0014320171|nr:hypothetical protein [Aeromonas veronii]NJI08725.1 hypothetical protein [Aeromonas veronii]
MKAKFVLLPFSLLGFFWGWRVLGGDLFWAPLKSIYGAAFWAYPVALAIDLVWSAVGKNQKLLNDFYRGIRFDLAGIFGGYAVLLLIYMFDGVEYSNSGIDLAAVGLPLVVIAILRLACMINYKVDGKPIVKKAIVMVFLFVVAFLALSVILLIETSKGKLDFYHSLWVQITFFCISLYLYIEIAKISFFLKSGKIAWSSIHRHMFSGSESGIYEQVRDMAIEHNNRKK